jgi:hypothetical protein
LEISGNFNSHHALEKLKTKSNNSQMGQIISKWMLGAKSLPWNPAEKDSCIIKANRNSNDGELLRKIILNMFPSL